LDASSDKHRIAMNKKSNDMETLANDLVENAPFEANKEISYVVNDPSQTSKNNPLRNGQLEQFLPNHCHHKSNRR
jgi:hypothetical protein